MPLLPDQFIWAVNNPLDIPSGNNAIAEPSVSKKGDGFFPEEAPPRQDLNYLHNNHSLWARASNSGLSFRIDGFRVIDMVGNNPGNISFTVSQGQALSSDKLFLFDSFLDTAFNGDSFIKFLSKASSETFVKGNDQPGLSPSLVLTNSTWYHAFLVVLADNDVDIAFDSDPDAANLITDLSIQHHRRIFSVHHGVAEQAHSFHQYGNFFMRNDALLGDTGPIAIGPGTPSPYTLPLDVGAVPTGIDTIGVFRAKFVPNTPTPAVPEMGITSVYETGATGPRTPIPSDGFGYGDIFIPIRGTNNQNVLVTHDITAGTVDLTLYPIGYIDNRGSDWGGLPIGFSEGPGKFWIV